jgi:hypothetical protein
MADGRTYRLGDKFRTEPEVALEEKESHESREQESRKQS